MSFADLGAGAGVSEQEARDAALFLTGRAHDREDARQLLEACGLLPYKPGTPVKARAEQGAVIRYPVRGQ